MDDEVRSGISDVPVPEAPPGGKEAAERARVLVVDDDDRNLLAIRTVLEDVGEIVEARSGEEALRHLLKGEFAVILLDVYMPGIDGYETARLLRERGARVAICAPHGDMLESAAKQLGALPVVADVSKEEDVQRLISTVVKEYDDYNVLINNAGCGAFAPLVDLTADEFFRVWQTNVLGAMLVARESAHHFIGRGEGNIVNIASTAGQRGFANGSAYCSSKFALHALTECWRAELRQHNIRVMQVNPSEVQTSFGAERSKPVKPQNDSKLVAADIGQLIVSMLELEDRGFVTEATMWATNPKDA
jgi:3-oxoacyl-[acyl-carrier protein] reductase